MDPQAASRVSATGYLELVNMRAVLDGLVKDALAQQPDDHMAFMETWAKEQADVIVGGPDREGNDLRGG